MTRINCVPVYHLCRQHLIAEYREIPRVFDLARKWYWRHEASREFALRRPSLDRSDTLPDRYGMGQGHVRFFYDKLGYIRQRHAELATEMRRRGYVTNLDCSETAIGLPDWMQKDWKPEVTDLSANWRRIFESIRKMRDKGNEPDYSGVGSCER